MAIEGKQLKAYLRSGDDEIFELLRQYAKSGTQGDVIRLALFRLFDVPVPDDLHVLDSLFQQGSAPVAPQPSGEIDRLAAIVCDLAEVVREGQKPQEVTVQMVQAAQVRVGPPQTLPDDDPPVVEQSSGLDMSRPRKRPALPRGEVVQPAHDVTEEFDAVAMGKLMAQSIKNAQPGRRT